MVEPRVLLGICTLQYQKRTVDSLLDTVTSFPFGGWVIPDVSLIHIARNKIVETAYEVCTDFTHILFVDDDMCRFKGIHVRKLLEDDKPIVSALVTKRSPPYPLVANFGPDPVDILSLIRNGIVKESSLVGMAFTLIKREVFDATREDTVDGPIWFTHDRWPRKTFLQEFEEFKATNPSIEDAVFFGQTSHIGSQLIGEDVNFCRRAEIAGFQAWVDCGVVVGHLGEGDFDFRDNIKCNQEKSGNGSQV